MSVLQARALWRLRLHGAVQHEVQEVAPLRLDLQTVVVAHVAPLHQLQHTGRRFAPVSEVGRFQWHVGCEGRTLRGWVWLCAHEGC